MPRFSDVPAGKEGPREIVEPIRQRRGGTLLKMDRVMLHSPPLAAAWNGFFASINNEFTLARKVREFIMCVVAVLNRADYEMQSHAPKFLAAGGTSEQLEALSNIDDSMRNDVLFDPTERAVLRLTVEMTQNIAVTPEAFADVKAVLATERELVELVSIVAAYNMVSRFVVAIGLTDGFGGL